MKPLVGALFLLYGNVVYVEPAQCKSLFAKIHVFLLISSFVDPCRGNPSFFSLFLYFGLLKCHIWGSFWGPFSHKHEVFCMFLNKIIKNPLVFSLLYRKKQSFRPSTNLNHFEIMCFLFLLKKPENPSFLHDFERSKVEI